MVESLIARWGYLAIGVGTFFEGETILIAGGALAHRGLLSLPLVMLSAFVGSVCGDQLWFHLGMRFGRPWLDTRPAWKQRASKIEAWLHRYGSGFVVAFRFIYGIRTVTPAVLGATGYSSKRFTILNVIGAAAWAASFSAAGWALGASLKGVLRRAGHIEELLLGAAALVLVYWFVRRWIERKALSRDDPTG
jgi:membrane protein DedA with SNARE-associated domain